MGTFFIVYQYFIIHQVLFAIYGILKLRNITRIFLMGHIELCNVLRTITTNQRKYLMANKILNYIISNRDTPDECSLRFDQKMLVKLFSQNPLPTTVSRFMRSNYKRDSGTSRVPLRLFTQTPATFIWGYPRADGGRESSFQNSSGSVSLDNDTICKSYNNQYMYPTNTPFKLVEQEFSKCLRFHFFRDTQSWNAC